jgi:NADP-dependent 3-hydroxy acid dehydrogenase YdfG
MYETIMIAGAGSGLGEGSAIWLAKQKRNLIATTQSLPQVSALRNKVAPLKLRSLRIGRVDLLDSEAGVRITPMYG